jgi:Cu/Ag efflux protein CusF
MLEDWPEQSQSSKLEINTMKTNALRVGAAVGVSVLTVTAALRASADQMATAARPEKSYTGLVTSVDPKEHVLNVKKWALWNKKFTLGADCACTFVDQGAGTINDLRPGQRVRVGYQNAHGVLVAGTVAQQPMRCDGTIKTIDPTQHALVLRGHGRDRKFQIANDCNVRLRNDKAAELGDVQTGDYVTVTYEKPDETPTARQIAQTSETFTGALTAIDLDGKTVKARSLMETKRFNVGDNCAIVINGKPDGKLSDLKLNEKLVISYDAVDGVNVVNRIAPSEAAPAKNVVLSGPSGSQ